MDLIFDIIQYSLLGFFGLLAAFVLYAVRFGERIERHHEEYEAKFRDSRGREIGEFDIDCSRAREESEDLRLRAKFRLRHPDLVESEIVSIYLDQELVMQGPVTQEGRISLRVEDWPGALPSPRAGQVCSVECAGTELMSVPLEVD